MQHEDAQSYNRTIQEYSSIYYSWDNPMSVSTLNQMTSNWLLAWSLARDKVYWPTNWCIWDKYAPPVYLKQGPKQSIGFPQLPRSSFPGTRIITHGKQSGGLQFFYKSINRMISAFKKKLSPSKRKLQWEWNKGKR